MKNLSLTFAALLAITVFGVTGCGGSGENEVIQNTEENVSGVTTEQQQQMEQDYQSGAGYSSQPGN